MEKIATIALDIDGTLIEKDVSLSNNVKECISLLIEKGHKIVFNTGRSYHFATKALHSFSFEYLLSVQNGAEILSMPSHAIFHQKLLNKKHIKHLQRALKGVDGDFLIYAGYENGDFCYFRPHNFTAKQLEYLQFLKSLTPIDWIALEDFDALTQDHFPLIKCLGSREAMQICKERLKKTSSLQVCLIDDRMSDFSILLITHKRATKGEALKKLLSINAIQRPIIAAGDDMNDVSMFEVADICIAMEDGAQDLRQMADIIAPCASEDGIIQGIHDALSILDKQQK